MLLLSFFILFAVSPSFADVSYVYDDLGRLFRVFDGQGQVATYHYDAVGNILRIDRNTAAEIQPVAVPSATIRGVPGSRAVITLTGSFLAGAEVTSCAPELQIGAIISSTDTQLVFEITISATAGPGTVCLNVTTPAGTTTAPFTIVGFTSITPTLLVRGASTSVTFTTNTDLTGAKLSAGLGIKISQVVISGTSLTATITPVLAVALQPFQVTVALPDLTLSATFRLSGIEIAPSRGFPGTVLSATITGTEVDLTGSTVSTDNPQVAVSNVETGPAQIALVLTIDPTASPGAVHILVDTPTSGQHRTIFTVIGGRIPPLAVMSISPPPGTPSAAIDLPIRVRFTDPLETATVSPLTVRVTDPGGQPIAGILTLSPDLTTVTFTPAQPLPAAASITVTLTTDLQSQNGRRLPTEESYVFTTAAREIFVDVTRGNDLTGDGTFSNPFATIGRGLSVAAAGTLVRAAPGTYPERVTIPSGVTLHGAGASQTILDGTGLTAPVITALQNVAILSLTVLNGPTGISAERPPLILGEVTLTGQSQRGIRLQPPSGPALLVVGDFVMMGTTVTNRIVICCDIDGRIMMTGNHFNFQVPNPFADVNVCCTVTGTVRFIGNTVSGGVVFLNGDLVSSATLEVVRNTANPGIGNAVGITACCDFLGPVRITDNVVTGSGGFEGLAFCCDFTAPVEVTHNTVTAALMSLCCRWGETTVADNTVTRSGFEAIFFCCDFSGPSTKLLRNTVREGKSTGVFFSSSTQITGTALVAANVIQQNGGVGLDFPLKVAPGTARIENNEITLNTGSGVRTSSFTSPTLRGNQITDNGGQGIVVFKPQFGAPGTGAPDLGTAADLGNNTVTGNGISDPTRFFDLTNETPNPISAIGNRWDHATAAEIDQFDIFDDEEGAAIGQTIGRVQFEPFLLP